MQTLRHFTLGWTGLFLFVFCQFALAATPQTMTVTCGGKDRNQKQEQKGLIRAKRDNATWVYNLIAGGDLKLRDVVWSYPGKGATAAGWGTTIESVVQAEKNYQMAWTSPLVTEKANTGNFKVSVTGKRFCPGGPNANANGPGIEETFEITWDADVVGIKILRGATDITDPQPNAQSVKVGEVIHLTTELEGAPAGAAITLPEWTVPEIFYKSWAEDGTAPVKPEVKANAIDFYWVDGGLGREVGYAVTVNGERLAPATAKFNVDRPSYILTVTPTGVIALGSGTGYPGAGDEPYLHYGIPNTVTAGVTFSTVPPRPTDNATNPVIRLAQLGTSIDRKARVGTKWGKWSITSGLDRYPGPLNDSPGQSVENTDELRFNDLFKTWLLYRPLGIAGAQWVPLQTVTWSWSATALKHGATWQNSIVKGQGDLVSAVSATKAAGTDTTEYPQWTESIADGVYNQIPAP